MRKNCKREQVGAVGGSGHRWVINILDAAQLANMSNPNGVQGRFANLVWLRTLKACGEILASLRGARIGAYCVRVLVETLQIEAGEELYCRLEVALGVDGELRFNEGVGDDVTNLEDLPGAEA